MSNETSRPGHLNQEGIIFPLIRSTTTSGSKPEIVALYNSHMLHGCIRSNSNTELHEELFSPVDDSALRGILESTTTISYSDIRLLGETRYKSEITTVSSCFWIKLTNGKTFRFYIPSLQARSVRALFASTIPDRYWHRTGSAAPTVIALAVAGLVIGFVSLYNPAELSDQTRVCLTVSSGSVLWFAWNIFRRRPRWRRVDNLAESSHLQSNSAKTQRSRKSKMPFRSKTVGTLLKLLGLGWWCCVVRFWTGPMNEIFGDNVYARQSVLALLWVIAPILIYLGYLLSLRGYQPHKRHDNRRPIVFLRPFQDDSATTLQPRGRIAEMSGLRTTIRIGVGDKSLSEAGRVGDFSVIGMMNPVQLLRMVLNYGASSTEESLARYFENYGPFIAIGQPGEPLSSPGAERMYLRDDEWQRSIANELIRAQAVVLQPGASEGVRWELEFVRMHIHPHRVLICLVSFHRNPQGYEDLLCVIEPIFRVRFPRRVPYLKQPIFIYFDSSWKPFVQMLSYCCPAFWPLIGDAADLNYTLQPFIQGMNGGKEILPKATLWQSGIQGGLAKYAAVIISILLAVATMIIAFTLF